MTPDGKLVYDIRKQMWAMYSKNGDITQLVNHFSEALAEALTIAKRKQDELDEIQKQIEKLHNLQ